MSEIKTCEQYVLAELEDCKRKIRNYENALETNAKLLDGLETHLTLIKDTLKKFLHLRESSTAHVIDCDGIYEAYEPEEFYMLASFLGMEVANEETEKAAK